MSEVKFIETKRTPIGESGPLVQSDVEARKYGDQMGLETPVVHTVNMSVGCRAENLSCFSVRGVDGSKKPCD